MSGVGLAADPAREAARPSVDVVVVAAGTSSRMGGVDKLEAPLGGRPLLARTLEALAVAPVVERIVVVSAADRVEALRSRAWLPAVVTAVVPGGARRQESVAAGLAALDDGGGGGDDRVVLIHDGARPIISQELVERVARAAASHGAAIPVLPMAETVKRLAGDIIVETVERADLATAQTPQGFRRSVLRTAHAQLDPFGPVEWTDEAALCESCTIDVHVVPGEPSNLKVTLPADLARAEAYLAGRTGPRIGLGHDSHPFGPGRPLALGGIELPDAPRLHGHSDGDVALHALADALLGAAGLGDLGRVFPAGPATPRGIASRELVAEVVTRVAAAGYRPASADLLIVGARPRLGEYLDSMRDAIAGLLRLPAEAVNVKASTGNLAGDDGAGRGISAQAIATVEAIP
jgi:2-C-methyl-D-erythritol 4-phosphate cytidylyltransferase/2-C-methyl-D-erythritol 2,4-cyclodiphosphate synthase